MLLSLCSGRVVCRFAVLFGAVVLPFSACSPTTAPPLPLGARSASSAEAYQAPSVPVFALAARVSKNGASAPEIIVYGAPGKSRPVYIPLKGLYSPFPMAVNAQQTVYVADYGKGGDEHLDTSVTEWDMAHSGPIRKITAGIAYPIAIAVTAAGRLSVANDFGGKAGTVTVYSKKSVRPSRTITRGIEAPSAITVDAKSGYTYIANPGNVYPPGGTVAEYSPKSNVPSVAIKSGLEIPNALGTDTSEHLYVTTASLPGVAEYAAHSATLIRDLSLGPAWEINTMALDPIGDVFVAARETRGSDWFGEIVEYGPSGDKPKRRMTFSVGVVPTSIVTDQYANLYAITRSFSGACTGSRCALLEFPRGEKGRVVIAKSSKATEIGGPIAVAP